MIKIKIKFNKKWILWKLLTFIKLKKVYYLKQKLLEINLYLLLIYWYSYDLNSCQLYWIETNNWW
jgi:hypothetical protein